MRFSDSEFLSLMAKVEDQGGVLSPDSCESDVFTLKQPAPGGKMRYRDIETQGCERESIFMIPYDVATHQRQTITQQDNTKRVLTPINRENQRKRGAGVARVCAVDDHVGEWPRFMNADEPEET